ncbi:MAG: hypothetical protein ILP19_08110 [Oscillospiraceae bacterium]|nr:hypothetical protein [Oscillospiraceae bacterium]
MVNQLKIESFRLKRFKPLYVSLLIFLTVMVYGMIEGMRPAFIEAHSCMYEGFADSIQDCSFAFLYGMLISWFVGIDFSNRTIHRSLTTGTGRRDIVLSRLVATSVIVIFFHIIQIVAQTANYALIYGVSFEGFGLHDLLWFLVVCIQLVAFTAFFILITIICGNVYSALFASVTVSAIGGNILRNVFRGNFIYEHSFFCLAKTNTSYDLIPCAVCGIIFIILLVTGTVILFNRRDVN